MKSKDKLIQQRIQEKNITIKRIRTKSNIKTKYQGIKLKKQINLIIIKDQIHCNQKNEELTLRGSSTGQTLGLLPNGHEFKSLQGP
jgi:hypothetical protein